MKKFEKKNAGSMERLRIRSGIYASAVTVLVVVLAAALALYALSWRLSVAWYGKAEQ